MELRRKGIDDETAREALDEIDPDDEVEVARALVRAKLRSVRGLDRDKAVRRLVGMLARKGHSAGVAFRWSRKSSPSGRGAVGEVRHRPSSAGATVGRRAGSGALRGCHWRNGEEPGGRDQPHPYQEASAPPR